MPSQTVDKRVQIHYLLKVRRPTTISYASIIYKVFSNQRKRSITIYDSLPILLIVFIILKTIWYVII